MELYYVFEFFSEPLFRYFDKYLKMAHKRFRKENEVSTSRDFDESKFSNFDRKIYFEKATKVNKGFVSHVVLMFIC